MIKRFKSQGTKAKKAKRNKPSPVGAADTENDVDILKMVREINFDNLGKPIKFESSNGHERSPSKKSVMGSDHQKSEKRKASDQTSAPVPKRRRSLSTHNASKSRLLSSTSKASLKGDDSLQVRSNLSQCIYIKP